ncbi:TOG array regulator of axonemal microtubules protein 2-like [Pristis pectinata]|uniref:TOG array regulator of axonemal microtubules protein 2-like n=1 Tax=Pristis pectinata TaxID=685728 RepID=UPI00223C8F7C|nr:TOG array regulator of axonemal microtubules protein 2-like [Pristis pectinata]
MKENLKGTKVGKQQEQMLVECAAAEPAGTFENSLSSKQWEDGTKTHRSPGESGIEQLTGVSGNVTEAFLQSSLNLPLEEACFVKSTGGGAQSAGGWVLGNNPFCHLFDGNRLEAARLHGYSVKLDWTEAETEEGHPSLDTLQLKNKLKRRMSEILLRKSPLETILPLKPALARSTSQKLLNATRPVPPIERSSVSKTQDAHDKEPSSEGKSPEATARESPGRPCWEPSEGLAEPAVVPEEVKISLQHLRSSAEKKRKLLGASLFQSSFKLPSTSEGSFQPLPSGPVQPEAPSQTTASFERDTVVQGLSSGSEERESQAPADGEDVSAFGLKGKRKSRSCVNPAPLTEAEKPPLPTATNQSTAGHSLIQSPPSLAEKVKGKRSLASQTTDISFRLSTEMGPDVSRRESVEGEEAETEERPPDSSQLCHMTISKSAQEKMRQRRRKEAEQQQLQKERELTRQLRERLQDIDPYSASLPVQELLNTREFNNLSLSSPGLNHGTSLRKRINRPSLPSIPNISQTYNVPRHFSAHSLPDFPLDSPEGEKESDEEEPLEISLFSRQEQGLTEALKLLANSDWEMKRQGLSSVRHLARFHQEILITRLHAVCLAVMKEVNNLRSKVARLAILTLGELFSQLKRNMDQEVEEVARILLHKTGDSNEFIRAEAVKALGIMTQSVSPSRALSALIAGGLNHRNTTVRKCTAGNLLRVVDHLGAERLLSGNKHSMDQLVQSVVKFSQDRNQETRFYGRKVLDVLVPHPEFGRYLERSLMSQDLHHIITAIKQRGLRDASSDLHSPKGWRSRVNSSSSSQEDVFITGRTEQDTPRQPRLVSHQPSLRSAETVEQVKQLSKMLTAKDFQERMQGTSLLLQHCETNPRFVTSNIVDIFDAFTPQLQDSNKKVNQFALQSLVTMIPVLKDDLHRVLQSTVTIVTDNLNSKNVGIYTAAVHVLDTLIDHIDNLLLLQPFASRVQFISGRARQDITERLAVLVLSVYQRKPQAVERYVLPVLWYLLGNMTGNGVIKGGSGNMRAVTAKLATSLRQQMGTGLQEYAQSQPVHVIKTLQDLTEKEL